MESSRRDVSNDMAEHRPILKNKQNTLYPLFSFTPKTGIVVPKASDCFYCSHSFSRLAHPWPCNWKGLSEFLFTDTAVGGPILKLAKKRHGSAHLKNGYRSKTWIIFIRADVALPASATKVRTLVHLSNVHCVDEQSGKQSLRRIEIKAISFTNTKFINKYTTHVNFRLDYNIPAPRRGEPPSWLRHREAEPVMMPMTNIYVCIKHVPVSGVHLSMFKEVLRAAGRWCADLVCLCM